LVYSYQHVSKTLTVLRHQLKQATQDIDTLHTLKRRALEDPYGFLEQLKSKKTRRDMPRLQKIVSTPVIDWSKYRLLPDEKVQEQSGRLIPTTWYHSHLILPSCSGGLIPPICKYTARSLQRELSRTAQVVGQMPSRAGSVSDGSDKESDDGDPSALPGKGKGKRRTSVAQTGAADSRATSPALPSPAPVQTMPPPPPKPLGFVAIDENGYQSLPNANEEPRPATFNQPWTDEEQRRLEELLIEFPDEPVQAQRFNKIANALGTRSARQVGSRVQKYFIKLAKMGLPVPGKLSSRPPSTNKGGNRGGSTANRAKVKRSSSSTPRPTARPPMQRTSGVGYNAIVSGGITTSRISGAHYLTAQAPPSALMSDDEEGADLKQVMIQAAQPGEHFESAEQAFLPDAFSCDNCGVDPIRGTRYKCRVCEEIDLCEACYKLGTFANDKHTPEHPFEEIKQVNQPAPSYADDDYVTPNLGGEYSYLGF
ncbi:hypothetical protein BCR43DRAFT_437422, partial [Syncephalastrum racemosum]